MFGECMHTLSVSYGLPASLFLAGLAGGFTHCIAMCGSFVVAQAQGVHGDSGVRRLVRTLILPYHLGRLTTYVFLAVLFSGFINLAFLFQPSKALVAAPLLLIAAVVFIVTAFPGAGALFPWAGRLRLPVPGRMLSRIYKPLFPDHRPASRYILGLFLGFMPCGLVVSALMAAAAAPTIWQSAGAMAAFGIGTLPALFLVGTGSGFLNRIVLPGGYSMRQGFMVLSAFWLFVLAAAMVF